MGIPEIGPTFVSLSDVPPVESGQWFTIGQSNPTTYTYAAIYQPRKRRWYHCLFRYHPRDRLIWSGPVDQVPRSCA